MNLNEFAALFPDIPASDVQYFVKTVAMAFEETGNVEEAIRLAHAKQVKLAEMVIHPQERVEFAGIVWDALQA